MDLDISLSSSSSWSSESNWSSTSSSSSSSDDEEQQQQQQPLPRKIFNRSNFDYEEYNPRQYRERTRMPKQCVDFLILRLSPMLERPSKRSNPFTPQQLVSVNTVILMSANLKCAK